MTENTTDGKIKYAYLKLSNAVVQNDVKALEELLRCGLDLKQNDGPRWLGIAAESGFTEIARLLIAHGVNVNEGVGTLEITPLMRAAFKNHIEMARLLIDSGAYVNARTAGGWTALIEAAGQGNTEMARLLIGKGAHINARTDKGWTSLLWAILAKKTETAKFLIESGADTEVSKDGDTPLSLAEKYNMKEIIWLLKDEPELRRRAAEAEDARAIVAGKQQKLKAAAKPIIIRRPQP